jgi:PAS domain S-box-containing protein
VSVLDQVRLEEEVAAKNGNGESSLAATGHPPTQSHDLQREVKERFGVLPNFFRLAPENPEITTNLWGFARFGYLDNPLPSLFKERLFVYLSRFCEVRYCIARHIGFLVGLGRPSGDAHCPVQTVDQVVRLIRRPFARAEQLDRLLSLCSTCDAPLVELPPSDSEMEQAIFACAAHAFLTTPDEPRCLKALRSMLGESRFQHLLVFMAFVRTAHYWTKVHAELSMEEDLNQLLATYEMLNDSVLNDPEAGACELGEQLRAELASVRTSVTHRELLQSLQESDSRLREMIDALPVAIYTTDAQGRLTHFNRAAVEFSGRTPELGTDSWCVTWKLYYPDGTPMPHDKCPMAIALKEGRVIRDAEAIAERPDGTRVWFTPFPTPLRDAEGKIVGGINMLLDITDRKLAEQASARLAAIVESSDDSIVSKDLNGIITSWNESAERLFGYTADEVIGRPVTILIPPDRLNEEPHILDCLRRGQRVDHFETVRMRKDGSLLDISLTISPVKDSAGRIVGASKIARDITERKRTEAALHDAHVQLASRAVNLEKLVGERTVKLRETISELESFSYSITHDMRAPLRAMQSFAAMLAEECSQLSGLGQDYARRIVASANRMDQLITDVLNYSRVAHADLPLKTVDTARLLREILESYPNFQLPQAVIVVEEKLPPVLGNEAALTQCISNLLGNAVKFVPAGTQPRVRIFFSQDDSHVHLSFQDNGIGIEPDAQKRIFQLFQRHDRKYEGTGLGLAIVKKGVERMGGSVTLTSKSGQGSTFCLHLRRADSR